MVAKTIPLSMVSVVSMGGADWLPSSDPIACFAGISQKKNVLIFNTFQALGLSLMFTHNTHPEQQF